MRGLRYVVVFAAACGNVATQQQDARVDGVADALACTSSQLACGTCVDPMTDKDHCGDCDTVCTAGESCTGGHCADMVTSCAAIKQINASAPDGFYMLLDGTQLYCDMTSSIGYKQLAIDNYNQTPAGFTLVTLADLQGAGSQKAFIQLYNHQGGALPVLEVPLDGIGNCAFKVSALTNMELGLSASLVIPATVGAAGPTSCIASYAATSLSFALNAGPVFTGTSMAADYFTTHPATEIAGMDSNNPGFFWSKVLP